jgi:catechol 2,3-dioxygenase-like lactoylglutathione lyase family enzyme
MPNTTDTTMTMRLELVPLAVSDVDRAKAFYVEQVGFHADHDVAPMDGMRVVQLTPPGSACSVLIGTGMGDLTDRAPGGARGLHLVVEDLEAARAVLLDRGVDISPVQDMGGILYAYFSDPDGNGWALQQLR